MRDKRRRRDDEPRGGWCSIRILRCGDILRCRSSVSEHFSRFVHARISEPQILRDRFRRLGLRIEEVSDIRRVVRADHRVEDLIEARIFGGNERHHGLFGSWSGVIGHHTNQRRPHQRPARNKSEHARHTHGHPQQTNRAPPDSARALNVVGHNSDPQAAISSRSSGHFVRPIGMTKGGDRRAQQHCCWSLDDHRLGGYRRRTSFVSAFETSLTSTLHTTASM